MKLSNGEKLIALMLADLMEHFEVNSEIDPSFVISHRLPLEEAPRGYEIFKHKQEDCTKVVLSA